MTPVKRVPPELEPLKRAPRQTSASVSTALNLYLPYGSLYVQKSHNIRKISFFRMSYCWFDLWSSMSSVFVVTHFVILDCPTTTPSTKQFMQTDTQICSKYHTGNSQNPIWGCGKGPDTFLHPYHKGILATGGKYPTTLTAPISL